MNKWINDISNLILSIFQNDTNNMTHLIIWAIGLGIIIGIIGLFFYFRQVNIESEGK